MTSQNLDFALILPNETATIIDTYIAIDGYDITEAIGSHFLFGLLTPKGYTYRWPGLLRST